MNGQGPMKLVMAFIAFRFCAIPPTAGVLARWGTFKNSGAIKVLKGFKNEISNMLSIINKRKKTSLCLMMMLP
uniref:Capsid protein n=1 Tax=Dengue virus type 3 TaxID=11069 RepID=A0A1B4XSU8_DENV3|nr:capsid protein [dengue virus type 3]